MKKYEINLRATLAHMITMAEEAIGIIRCESAGFVALDKVAYDGVNTDVFTNADVAAQAMYLKRIETHFPLFGIIGEEDNLRKPCAIDGENFYFTIDPLDGTKAFIRQQSSGVATMIALIRNGEALAAVIGDVNTGELFYFAKGVDGGKVKRIRFGQEVPMQPNTKDSLRAQYINLRQAPSSQPDTVIRMIRKPEKGGLFKDLTVCGGSIGLAFAKLWFGEVGALVLEKHHATPWDASPAIALSEALGFKFFGIDIQGKPGIEEIVIKHHEETVYTPYNKLIVHKDHAKELQEWYQKFGAVK